MGKKCFFENFLNFQLINRLMFVQNYIMLKLLLLIYLFLLKLNFYYNLIYFQDNTNNDVYLEAQIQNLCTSPLILEKVVLETSDLYTSVELTTPEK